MNLRIFALPFMLSSAYAAPALDADTYNQWKDALKSTNATPAGEVRALPGFKVELVRPALPGEGSWVALAFDAKGRAIISREDKGLLRLTLPSQPGDPGVVESIDDTLLEVRGLLCEGGRIFANANNSKTLVMLSDADGDGGYEQRATLMETSGGAGHGRNQIARAPDGKLWAMAGDDVQPPEGVGGPFRFRGADRLFTADWDRFHWSNQVKPPCGHVTVLADHAGADLLCGGLRNPFGIAFNEDGEAFTYDADMEWDVGLPWYRPTRVLHLVSGADYGWRGASRALPAWMPDTWPAVCDIGKGSPTAIMFGTKSKWPDHWRRALYIMDWAYGIIYAVHLTPKGSTYEGRHEVFLQGRPLNVTSLDFGPDGAMYFVTGGRRTQSGLYRVTWTEEAAAPAPQELPPALLSLAKEARNQRKELDLPARMAIDDNALTALVEKALASDDPFLRKAAVNALRQLMDTRRVIPPADNGDPRPSKPVRKREAWLDFARQAPPRAGLAIALAASESKATPQALLLDILLARDWAGLAAEDRTTLLRAMQLSLIRGGTPGAEELRKLAAYVGKAIPCGQPHPDMLGAELLVFLDSPHSAEKVLPLIEKAATQEERLHYLFTLRHVKTGWTMEHRRAWLAAFRRESARSVGAHHLGVTLRYCRAEFEATLSPVEKSALTSELATLDPAAAAVPPAEPRAFVKAWTMAELEPKLPAAASPERDLIRGRALFDSQCAACHRFGPQGGVIGPDLTGIAGRFDRRTILESIVDPWKVVADPYRIATATLKTGEIISGRVTGDDGTSVHIEVNPVDPGTTRKTARTDTTSLSFTSLMPPGLANTMSAEELLDLLAVLEGR